jgi:hypothetical protein
MTSANSAHTFTEIRPIFSILPTIGLVHRAQQAFLFWLMYFELSFRKIINEHPDHNTNGEYCQYGIKHFCARRDL